MKMEMYFSSGSSINIVTDESWQAAIESSNNSKLNAKVIALAGEKPWRLPDPDLKFNPAAYFRHSFKLDKKIARAFVYASALGLYHLRINEKDVSNDLLRPGWSDFNATVYYNSYEVTDILKSESENLINVILADGYYSGYCGWEKGRGYYGKIPSIKIQLMIDYDDGTNKIIYTNESWTSSEGPIREADILMGEVYDSNYEWLLESWESNSTTANFCPVIIKKDINPKMISYCAETIRNRYELSAQHIKRICDKKFIIDFGQNFAGFVRLKLFDVGRRKIILRFAEMLNSDGSIYTDNLRMARAQDIYYSRGDTQEIWQPTFTYHGFRYVEITGLDEVEYETAVGISIHSLTEQTGYFTSSDEKLNKLFSCILWNQRSNYIDIPTDCPQRDERLGWLGDAVSFFSTSAYNYDVSAFYTKWLRDLFRAQNEDGSLPPFVPFVDLGVGPVYFNSAGWADAGIITPYLFNGHYNDKALLSELYTQMKKFIHSLEANSQNYILPNTGYGDWLYRGDDTSKSLIATAYFAYDCYLMSIMADILEFKSDTEYYDTLFNKIKDIFRRTFINANGYIKDQTQTAAVLCLNFNLLEKEEREKAISFLIQSIIDSDYHVSTGFLGLSFILQVLTSFGRNDIAWKIITNDEFPSWFNFINLGATTLWERWDSYHPKSGFFDPTMNSFNHCSLGCIGEWLFTNLAGIQAVEPGFKKFKVSLFIPDDLMSLKVSFKSIYGVIKVSWNKKENFVFLNVAVPFNTQAIITIPSKEYEVNTKHSKIQQFEKYTILETGSGKYEIRWKSY
ncbi:MAG: family 78 glycoside hydrolase catalytic domain [Ignavibacteriaceae bacterium]|nr:family 78 glycoside hydrolase catalytic domain [Ignavibacteriaceae bacterium]